MVIAVRRPVSALLARARRRRQERGAVVFVVVLVITLLSALGIWTARSATMVDVSAGYSRQALQVQYVADLGLQSTTAFLANGLANEFVRLGSLGAQTCTQSRRATPLVPLPFCYPFFSTDLDGTFATRLLSVDSTVPGENSLGPYGTGTVFLRGEFVVEMTDIGPAPPCRGCELDDVNTTVKNASVMLSSIATIHAGGAAGPATCSPAGAATSGRQMLRGHTVIGPIFQ